ncbi:hypothetical protein [Stenotrophomonas sp.]|uniref:hypothetical protein n=1 Tax=Stenotrophomonas sp. TaxID=69392 RepID=UPI0028B1C74C|nr:hypothetical protein [Stenotrophomonas sp.]
MDNGAQALRCKAFKMAVNFSPRHYNEGVRFFVGAASAPKHAHRQVGQSPGTAGTVSFAADAAPASSHPAYRVLHKRCAQWLEKVVDNRLQALRCKAFKILVNF